MYTPLLTHIKKFIPMDEKAADALTGCLRYNKLKKKEYLLKEGEVCTANYFVRNGCIRMYFLQDNGVEQIVQFGVENWWITDHQSLDWRQPSCFHIQAVEASEVIVLDHQAHPDIFDRVPGLDRYFRMIMQRAFAASQQRLRFIYSFSGEERYRHFCDAFPWFMQRVPQYMVASYLGLTPEFVSKVRNRRRP